MLVIPRRGGEGPEKDCIRDGVSSMTGPEQRKSRGDGQKITRPLHEGTLWIYACHKYTSVCIQVLSTRSGRLSQIINGYFLQSYRNYLLSSSILCSLAFSNKSGGVFSGLKPGQVASLCSTSCPHHQKETQVAYTDGHPTVGQAAMSAALRKRKKNTLSSTAQ